MIGPARGSFAERELRREQAAAWLEPRDPAPQFAVVGAVTLGALCSAALVAAELAR